MAFKHQYEKSGFRLLTDCTFRYCKIGSATCEKDCRFFISHNYEMKTVECMMLPDRVNPFEYVLDESDKTE